MFYRSNKKMLTLSALLLTTLGLSGCSSNDQVCTTSTSGDIGYDEKAGANASFGFSRECKPRESNGDDQTGIFSLFTDALHAYTQSSVTAADVANYSLVVSASGATVVQVDGQIKVTLTDDYQTLDEELFEYEVTGNEIKFKYPEQVANWVSGYESLITGYAVDVIDVGLAATPGTVTVQSTAYEGTNSISSHTTSFTYGSTGGPCHTVICKQ